MFLFIWINFSIPILKDKTLDKREAFSFIIQMTLEHILALLMFMTNEAEG